MNRGFGETPHTKSLKSLKAKQGEAGEVPHAKSLKSWAKQGEGQKPPTT